jgi:hypothetical protein
MPDSDTIVRDERVTPGQRIRNVIVLITCVVTVLAVAIAVRNRLIRTSIDEPGNPVPLPVTGPTVIESRHPVSGFVHPGIVVSVSQLEHARARIRAGDQPWAAAYETMWRSGYASLNWRPNPRETVECGYFSNPDLGCTAQRRDAVAAYTHALLWYLTGERAFAEKAIEIIDAWATTLREYTNLNAPIQAGWSAASFVRAAELIRHTYDGWPTDAIARAETMFREVLLPMVRFGGAPGSGGNWDLIILDAAISIAVFLDDRTLFDETIERWRSRLPAYIYLGSDGPWPVAPPGASSQRADVVEFWHGLTTFVDGVTQETCRDLAHTAWGLEAAAQIAETAWIQGVDIYTEAQSRLVAALELHAGLALGEPVPDWLCGGSLTATFSPIPEIAYNHYHNRQGIPLPKTRQLLDRDRPQSASHFYAWATLTHA